MLDETTRVMTDLHDKLEYRASIPRIDNCLPSLQPLTIKRKLNDAWNEPCRKLQTHNDGSYQLACKEAKQREHWREERQQKKDGLEVWNDDKDAVDRDLEDEGHDRFGFLNRFVSIYKTCVSNILDFLNTLGTIE